MLGIHGRWAEQRRDVLVDDRQETGRPEHPPRLLEDRVSRLHIQMLEHLHGNDSVEASGPEREPAGGGVNAVDPAGLGQHARREVEPDDPGPPGHKRPGEPALAAAQVEDPPAVDRSRSVEDGLQAIIVDGQRCLEPLAECVESQSDLGLMRGDHDAPPAALSSRSFQLRTATDAAESAQNIKPSAPSRKPCL